MSIRSPVLSPAFAVGEFGSTPVMTLFGSVPATPNVPSGSHTRRMSGSDCDKTKIANAMTTNARKGGSVRWALCKHLRMPLDACPLMSYLSHASYRTRDTRAPKLVAVGFAVETYVVSFYSCWRGDPIA